MGHWAPTPRPPLPIAGSRTVSRSSPANGVDGRRPEPARHSAQVQRECRGTDEKTGARPVSVQVLDSMEPVSGFEPLSFPCPLRFLFASRSAIMGQVLGIVYRAIAGQRRAVMTWLQRLKREPSRLRSTYRISDLTVDHDGASMIIREWSKPGDMSRSFQLEVATTIHLAGKFATSAMGRELPLDASRDDVSKGSGSCLPAPARRRAGVGRNRELPAIAPGAGQRRKRPFPRQRVDHGETLRGTSGRRRHARRASVLLRVALHRLAHQLGTAGALRLALDLLAVDLDGAHASEQALGDLGRR